MMKKLLKRLEQLGKAILESLIVRFLPQPYPALLPLDQIHKILVFRLDERIGNGIMLLPLLRAIRTSRPDSEIQLLIHHPVAELFAITTRGLITRFWPYDQPYLMRRPWKMLNLFFKLRKEKFDVVITSHNPDNFSFSQALLGKWCHAKRFVGFNWKNSARYYDIAVPPDLTKHYADAMFDLWRFFDPEIVSRWGGLHIPESIKQDVQMKYPYAREGDTLIWLGAGKGGKKAIPDHLVKHIYEFIGSISSGKIVFATGPADVEQLENYSVEVREKIIIWKENLLKTAAFFSCFKLFISGDTGPLHLAAALNLATLGIFLHTDMKRYGYNDGKQNMSVLWEGRKADYENLEQILWTLLRKNL
ncbi:MAG: glycosyltransferase family 9 protein [Calditrichia bacterium]